MRARISRRISHVAVLAIASALATVATGPASAQDPAAPPEPAPASRKPTLAASVTTEFPVSEHRVLDVDGDGRADLVAIGVAGEVRVWRHDAATGRIADAPTGTLVLADPGRSLIAIADVLGTGRAQLAVLTRQGLFAHPVGADGAFQRGGILVSKDVRLKLRTGRPRFADVTRDVNGDGRIDVLVPRADSCELWLAGAPAAQADGTPAVPTLRLAATVKIDVQRERSIERGALSDLLESTFRIPALRIADVNGDRRADLAVEDGKRRAFHLAREDGSLPADADVQVDLAIFEDTTPKAEVQLGRTLAGSDDQRFETADLDADGIPDYVIAHRRKVWIFRGRATGPQFTEPSQVLRVSEDVTAMMLLRLDADERPDLLLMRVQVPTVATLLRGLVASWDIDVAALGYANRGGDGFETNPKWKGGLAIRLPAILGVLKDPDALIRKFESVSGKFRTGVDGDFDGDGRGDIAIADSTGEGGAPGRIGLWYAPAEKHGGTNGNASGGIDGESDEENAVADVFFGAEDRVWDLDRILGWLGSIADQHAAKLTGGRAADTTIPLRPVASAAFQRCVAGNLDGVRGDEVVVVYELEDRRAVFEVWR